MSSSRIGNMAFIEEKMDQDKHTDVLRDNLQSNVQKPGLDGVLHFQQDNNLKRTAWKIQM